MGSYCSIYFDDLEACSSKSVVPDEFCAIFQESDKVMRRSGDADEYLEVIYETTRDIVLSRLALMGYIESVARERLSRWLDNERDYYGDYRSYENNEPGIEVAKALHELTPEEWYTRIPGAFARRHARDEPIDEIDRHMQKYGGESWFWFDGYGSLVSLRALLDACPNVKTITLDITDLVDGGWLYADEKICDACRKDNMPEAHPLTPTIILAEGRSDIKILKHSLVALFPERNDYFSFFEHAELNVDGGASYLVKFLKAFATARASFRMIAVFDNDTEGLQAYYRAGTLQLPDNISVIRLPDIELAKAYPTIGPQGHHIVDINGQAASIELYLGRKALTIDNDLSPVRWTGYNKAAQAYQGEVEAKPKIQEGFFRELTSFPSSSEARTAFLELVVLWETIFSAVVQSAEASKRKLFNRIGFEIWR